jgi:hypothetical protein
LPWFEAEVPMIDYCIHVIKRATQWAASDRGDFIQLETIDENQKGAILRMEFQDVSWFALVPRSPPRRHVLSPNGLDKKPKHPAGSHTGQQTCSPQ